MYFAFLCYHKLVNKDLYITAVDWRTTIKGNIKSQIADWRSADQLSAAAAARRAKKNWRRRRGAAQPAQTTS